MPVQFSSGSLHTTLRKGSLKSLVYTLWHVDIVACRWRRLASNSCVNSSKCSNVSLNCATSRFLTNTPPRITSISPRIPPILHLHSADHSAMWLRSAAHRPRRCVGRSSPVRGWWMRSVQRGVCARSRWVLPPATAAAAAAAVPLIPVPARYSVISRRRRRRRVRQNLWRRRTLSRIQRSLHSPHTPSSSSGQSKVWRGTFLVHF